MESIQQEIEQLKQQLEVLERKVEGGKIKEGECSYLYPPSFSYDIYHSCTSDEVIEEVFEHKTYHTSPMRFGEIFLDVECAEIKLQRKLRYGRLEQLVIEFNHRKGVVIDWDDGLDKCLPYFDRIEGQWSYIECIITETCSPVVLRQHWPEFKQLLDKYFPNGYGG